MRGRVLGRKKKEKSHLADPLSKLRRGRTDGSGEEVEDREILSRKTGCGIYSFSPEFLRQEGLLKL